MATEPNLIDAGATEIVVAPGVLCWLDAALGALVSPIQPELDKIAESRRTRAATGIAFLPAELGCVARFSAPADQSSILRFFIAPIVVCGKWEDYCPNVHLKDRGEPAPDTQLWREAAGRSPAILDSPPNSIRFNPARIYGTVAETSAE
jgi:hypothetical protein